MKKQFAFLIPVFILVLFVASSCGKEDDPIVVKTKTQLLSQGTWKFKSATFAGSDVSSSIQSCQRDNILAFVSTGTGSADEGLTKCNMSDPQTNPFAWNFQSGETILFISTTLFTGGSSTFDLITLTETELVVSQGITVGPGPTRLIVVTFIH